MDLAQGLVLAVVTANVALNARIYYQLGQLVEGFKDLRRRVSILEGAKHELATKAA